MTDSTVVKDLLLAVSPLIKSLVDTFVTPKLENLRNKIQQPKNRTFIPTEEHFSEYFHRTFKRLAVVNTLVFSNSQRILSDIFIPLTLACTNKDNTKTKVSGFPSKLSDKYGNILITDTAGMGKSTLMKTIFIDLLNKCTGIPIFVELRRLNHSKTLIDEIKEQLNSINKDFDSDLLLDLLAEGGFIIILDGYDEIAITDRDKVTSDLQQFISKASNNRYFITSRPEKALASFGNFQEFKIDPLSKKEAFELLRKYDSQGHVSALLIKKLQEKEQASIEEFLTNPLLVSLLFTAFEYKQAIPFKKHLFYRQVYDANFESHDLTKGDSYTRDKYSNLEIDDFHRVLRHIGFDCLKLQRIEFTKDEILKLIRQSRDFCVGLNFKESDYLLDILKTVPLFAQDGNYFRWSHKSLQEYFAAQFIYLDSKGKQNSILLKLYNHPNLEKFINTLDLYYDMDYKTFRNTIEYNILKEYKHFSDNFYININEGISSKEVKRRKELTFLTDSYIFKALASENKLPFEDDRLSDMIEDFRTTTPLHSSKFSGILVNPDITENIYGIYYQNVKTSILTLLSNKRNSIVRMEDRPKGERKIIFKFQIEEEYKMIKISDSKEDELNSAQNFSSVNFLLQATKLFNIKINHDICLRKLREIELCLELENKEDFLTGDI